VSTLEDTCVAAFDLLPDAVIAADERGKISFVNRAATRLLGWRAEELCGRPLTAIMPARMHVIHEAGFGRYVTTHHPRIMGHPIRVPALRRDGSELDIELTLAAARVLEGHEIIIGTLRDRSDRVELERQIRVSRYMRATTAAAAQLRSVFDVDRVLWVAVETLVEQFDAALARVWLKEPHAEVLRLRASAGLSRRVEGSSRHYVDIATHPFKLGVVARTRQPCTKNGLMGDPQYEQDWVRRERLEAAASLPLLVSGDLEGVLVAFFRYRLDEEAFDALAMLAALVASAVNDANLYDRAQCAIRRRDDVLSVVSHDLRGPLSIIEMGTTWLMRRGGDDESSKTVLRIRRAGTRMEVLIRDLLDESAIEAGRLRIEPVKQAVGPLVSEAMELMRPIADEKRVSLSVDVVAPDAEVVCDRARIVQVFSNLVGNAIKFTKEGGAVRLRVSGDDGTVKFAVTWMRHRAGGAPARVRPLLEGPRHRDRGRAGARHREGHRRSASRRAPRGEHARPGEHVRVRPAARRLRDPRPSVGPRSPGSAHLHDHRAVAVDALEALAAAAVDAARAARAVRLARRQRCERADVAARELLARQVEGGMTRVGAGLRVDADGAHPELLARGAVVRVDLGVAVVPAAREEDLAAGRHGAHGRVEVQVLVAPGIGEVARAVAVVAVGGIELVGDPARDVDMQRSPCATLLSGGSVVLAKLLEESSTKTTRPGRSTNHAPFIASLPDSKRGNHADRDSVCTPNQAKRTA
jgi:PAS domain S-box-containing protein